MSDDDTAGSSLLLAQHHSAHREHSQHQHLHGSLHRKRQDLGEAVTEIVATISIIQKINVDINGNTITIQTIQTHLDSDAPPITLTDVPLPELPALATLPSLSSKVTEPSSVLATSLPVASPSSSPEPPAPEPTYPAPPLTPSFDPQPSSTVAGSYQPLPSLDVASVLTSTPSIDTATTLSSLITTNSINAASNSTTFAQTYTNSSRSSTRLSSSKSSRSSSLLKSSTKSTSLYTSSTYFATPTEEGFVAAGTSNAFGAPENTAPAAGGSSSDDGSTPTPVVIGGVVGSIAGAALLIVAILFLLRWRKRGRGLLRLGDGGMSTVRSLASNQPSGMTERRNTVFAIPAAFSKRFSQKAEENAVPAAGSEKSFYRVSGRKLPSVLQTGGDGYGTELHDDDHLYRDSHAFFGGSGPPPLPLGGPMPSNRESSGGVPIFRPSPARTPTREESPFSLSPSDATPPPPRRPDVLGRSHASRDGSHASRFTEEV